MLTSALCVSNHPVCAALVASQHFLTGAATPPHEEGNMPDYKLWVKISNCPTTYLIGNDESQGEAVVSFATHCLNLSSTDARFSC